MYDYLQANWGESPSRSDDQDGPELGVMEDILTGWSKLTEQQREYVLQCFRGNTLQQVLEGITFWFTFDGVTRPFTHQAVRTRDAAFMQHGGRDNDWRHRRFTMPETVHRAFPQIDSDEKKDDGLKHCIRDPEPILKFLGRDDINGADGTLRQAIETVLEHNKALYAALVDAGIPWEDARRFLPMGFQTYLHGIYDWLTLSRTLANRLEHIMDWEYNCVAQLMHREVYIACPMLGDFLGSHSDKAKKAMYAGLESWPPDGKWPSPFDRCKQCNWDRAGHDSQNATTKGPHDWDPEDILPRAHRPEQNPFWVLTPAALKGGPIEWIPTNGVYPHDKIKEMTK